MAGNACAPAKSLYYFGGQDQPCESILGADFWAHRPASEERESSVCRGAQSLCPEKPFGSKTK